MPEAYAGDRVIFRHLLGQVQQFLTAQPLTYSNDTQRIALICSLLTGQARAWLTPFYGAPGPILTDLNAFITAFTIAFDDPDRAGKAADSLRLLRLGSD
ncbi:hypothetical protein B5P41_32120, partial [Bacillus sp. SRB_28]